MSTGYQYVNIQPKKLLGFSDFRERYLDYIRNLVRDSTQKAHGQDGFFNENVTFTGEATNEFSISVGTVTGDDAVGTDDAGNFLQLDAELAGRSPNPHIKFENTNLQVYNVGLHYAERPRGITINPRTGKPEFSSMEETVGEMDEPTSVTDNGSTITFNINSVAQRYPADAGMDQSGRYALVWKVQPGDTATSEGDAVEKLLVAFSSPNCTVTTTGLLGQVSGAVSTNASDYRVVLLGPTVTKDIIVTKSGYLVVGAITGNAGTPSSFSYIDQSQLLPAASIDISDISYLGPNGDLKLRVRAHALDVEEPQFTIQDAGLTVKFQIDEDGDTFIAGDVDLDGSLDVAVDLAVHGTFDIDGDLTVGGTSTLGNDAGDSTSVYGALKVKAAVSGDAITMSNAGHINASGSLTVPFVSIGTTDVQNQTIKGNWLHKNAGSSATIFNVHGGDGKVGIGGAYDPTKQLRVYESSEIDGSLKLGRNLDNDEATSRTSPRLIIENSGDSLGSEGHGALLTEYTEIAGGVIKTRIYVAGTESGGDADDLGDFYISVNALANDEYTLEKDDTAVTSSELLLQAGSFRVGFKSPTASVWDSRNGWDGELVLDYSTNKATLKNFSLIPGGSFRDLGETGTRWGNTYSNYLYGTYTCTLGRGIALNDTIASASEAAVIGSKHVGVISGSFSYTKLLESLKAAAGTGDAYAPRTYIKVESSNTSVEDIINGSYGLSFPTGWTRDLAGNTSVKKSWSKEGLEIQTLSTIHGDSGISDTNWDMNLGIYPYQRNTADEAPAVDLFLYNGRVRFFDIGATDGMAYSNPKNDETLADNTLCAKAVPKAFGHVTVNAGAVAFEEGLNFTASVDGTRLKITFNNPPEDTGNRYAGTASMVSSTQKIFAVVDTYSTYMDIYCYDNNGTLQSPSSVNLSYTFNVCGRQGTEAP